MPFLKDALWGGGGPGGRGGRPRALIPGEGVAWRGKGLGPRASVPGGVGGRGTGPRDGANFATCVFVVSNA